jgi:hypothetical protein
MFYAELEASAYQTIVSTTPAGSIMIINNITNIIIIAIIIINPVRIT